jgi:ketosteroid isomerase-like protein
MKAKVFLVALLAFSLPKFVFAGPNAEAQLTKIEHNWAEAYVKRDPSFVKRITADDFIFVGPDGNSVGKSDYVKGMTGPTVFTAFDVSDLKIRTYNDVAVVVGIATITAKTGDKDESGKYAFTDMFVKQRGEWKAVSSQATPVRQVEPAK